MREISRRTEGPSKPPTLRIYLSFFPPPASYVLCFCLFHSSHICFSARLLAILTALSSFALPVSLVPFPALQLSKNTENPTFFPVPGFSGDPETRPGLAFLWPDIYNCRVELWNVKWIKGNRYLGESEHLAAGCVIKTCRLKTWRRTQAERSITLSRVRGFRRNCWEILKWTCPAADVK